MKNENVNALKEPNFIAFLFDTGKIDELFYGDTVFKNFIDGLEITSNSRKVVVSVGDIFNKHIYDDITPFIVRDNICTIEKSEKRYANILFAFSVEDIETQIAISIDKRLKSFFPAYLGMTTIDEKSTDIRKQFWKSLVRSFSIEGKTITCFCSEEEGGFCYNLSAEKKGFRINYDGFSDDFECYENNKLFSTRQSSFIQSIKQYEYLDGQNDSDRGISEMNFALVKETEIAGVQIWKAIEDINLCYISKNESDLTITDYIFTSLYQAAQGIERLLKIILQLIIYNSKDNAEKRMVNNLLLGHNHPAMFDYVSKMEDTALKPNAKNLLILLSSFYSKARYHRFRYSENTLLELKLLQDFGHNIKEDDFNEQVKHLYGKALGQTAQVFYKLIDILSRRLNIYVYELNSESVARFALIDYYGDDLYKTLKQIEQSKKELLWYLIKKGNELPAAKITDDISPLQFNEADVNHYIKSLIINKNACCLLYDFVSQEYDELVKEDKEQWKERIDAIDVLVGTPNVIFDEDVT
jgi:hypothetical protein